MIVKLKYKQVDAQNRDCGVVRRVEVVRWLSLDETFLAVHLATGASIMDSFSIRRDLIISMEVSG